MVETNYFSSGLKIKFFSSRRRWSKKVLWQIEGVLKVGKEVQYVRGARDGRKKKGKGKERERFQGKKIGKEDF
jgi:hypothetical protein